MSDDLLIGCHRYGEWDTGLGTGLSRTAGANRRQAEKGQHHMQYALLIYERPGSYAGLTDEQRQGISAEYLAIRRDTRIIGGAQLKSIDTATTVRMVDGQDLITDGPFADTKEVFGGYYILEADNVDAALEIAQRIPAVRLGGAVEVRPMVELPN
jgi:hypothetical protein